MNFESEQLVGWLAHSDQVRAGLNYQWLVSHFAGLEAFHADLIKNASAYKLILSKEISSSKAVEELAGMVRQAREYNCPLDDLALIYNDSACLAILLQAGEDCKVSEETLNVIEAAHEVFLSRYLNLITEQADALVSFLLQINNFFARLRLGDSRIILADLPIGNSLPVLLLNNLISSSARTETIRVALTRNDSKNQGITREQLLADEMNRLGLRKNDVVLHFDEWDTGVNFNRITKIQQRILKKSGAFYFAAAVLTDTSAQSNNFGAFCNHHDKILANWGETGSDFRKVLPALKTLLKADGYFFWSENDRMAGYRKMQVHGSMFSTIDETLKLLHDNENELHRAVGIMLAVVAGMRDLPESAEKGFSAMKNLFQEGYEDYLQCRDELQNCTDAYSAQGEVVDLHGEFVKLSPNYAKVLDGRKAKIAVIHAITYSRRLGSIDPTDRYYFKGQAPMVSRLEGRMAVVHRVTVNFMNSRIQHLRR